MSRPRLSLKYQQGKWHHLYNDPRWKNPVWGRRAVQLQAEPLCAFCLPKRVTVATVADHVEPHWGDEDKFFNGELQSLCDTCHSSTKQQMERSGRVRGCRVDGKPIDPNHPWNRSGG